MLKAARNLGVVVALASAAFVSGAASASSVKTTSYDEIKPWATSYNEIKPWKTAYNEIKPWAASYNEIKPWNAA